ncbi:MAG: EamA family transporter [Pseudomonadota bacterium]|nr:EamA family transporter [Pseudomonadota bacterium]
MNTDAEQKATIHRGWRNRGVLAALAAAVLFGAGTPAAKLLVGVMSPWILAGLLYLGSGLGLLAVRLFSARPQRLVLTGRDMLWLAVAVAMGGVVGPVLLMWGLSQLAATDVSLLLNAEAVFTVVLAWVVFREHVDRRIAFAMGLIVAGALVLTWPTHLAFGALLPTLSIIGACLAWGIDNNVTRKVALADATFIAMTKGLAAGATNLLLALAAGELLPSPSSIISAAVVGFLSFGVSLVLFVTALRQLGTARTAAYFSIAPFVGALISIAFLGEPATFALMLAGSLMAAGLWLHLTEQHEHRHHHHALEHEHEHGHDEHHRHEHACSGSDAKRHAHLHRHEPLAHSHHHYPDSHHRHEHGEHQ